MKTKKTTHEKWPTRKKQLNPHKNTYWDNLGSPPWNHHWPNWAWCPYLWCPFHPHNINLELLVSVCLWTSGVAGGSISRSPDELPPVKMSRQGIRHGAGVAIAHAHKTRTRRVARLLVAPDPWGRLAHLERTPAHAESGADRAPQPVQAQGLQK